MISRLVVDSGLVDDLLLTGPPNPLLTVDSRESSPYRVPGSAAHDSMFVRGYSLWDLWPGAAIFGSSPVWWPFWAVKS